MPLFDSKRNMDLLKLAQQYAQTKGTTILGHRFPSDDVIVFTLASGPKYTMTAEELAAALRGPASSAEAAEEPAAPPPAEQPKKGKANRGK